MKNKFTLVELIVSVVVLTILSAIVILQISNWNKESVNASVSTNTSIIQNAVDRYYLDNGEVYPIKNDLKVNLSKPQLVDTEKLLKKGYLKKDLDLSKVRNQYYWIDVFGKVWGSTDEGLQDYVVKKDSKLEFTLSEKVTGYNIYEVSGYSSSGISTSSEKKYKEITSVQVKRNNQLVQVPTGSNGKTYLVSTVDQYGLESAPFGAFTNGKNEFQPLLREGEYEFEIASNELMEFIDFKTLEDKPLGTKITYSFKVKDKDGAYGEYTDDYFSLSDSKGIKVKVHMVKSASGENPRLLDMRVIYNIKNQQVAPFYGVNFPEEVFEEDKYSFAFPYDVETIKKENEEGVSSVRPNPSTDKTVLDKTNTTGISVTCPPQIKYTSFSEDLETGVIVYNYYLAKGNRISKMSSQINSYPYQIKSVSYEYAVNGVYKEVDSLQQVPEENCFSIIYELHKVYSNGYKDIKIPIPVEPTIEVCTNDCYEVCTNCMPPCELDVCEAKKNNNSNDPPFVGPEDEVCIDSTCYPPACTTKCSPLIPEKVTAGDPLLNDSGWKTVNTMKFFASSDSGKVVNWTSFSASDVVPDKENGRIVYRFAKMNDDLWSEQLMEFSEVRAARSVVVFAYIQIKNNSNLSVEKQPTVNSVTLLNQGGAVVVTKSKPSAVIRADKSNNQKRASFSNTTKVKWTYLAADTQGKKIVETEWTGDVRETYPIGLYSVFLRVKNSDNVWSEKVNYVFSVKEEMPIAVIDRNSKNILLNESVGWNPNKSIDPDGDGLVQLEWAGDYASRYSEAGDYSIKLRVRDGEGNWSAWTEENFTVHDPSKIKPVININASEMKVHRYISFDYSGSELSGGKLTGVEWRKDGGNASPVAPNGYYEEGNHTVSLRIKTEIGVWSNWVDKSFLIEKGAGVQFAGLNSKAYDNNLNTNFQVGGDGYKLTWTGGDLDDSVLDIYASVNTPAVLTINAVDKNGVILNTTSTGSTLKNRIAFYIPAGTVAVTFGRGSNKQHTGFVWEVNVNEDRIKSEPLRDLKITPTDHSVTFNWVNPTSSDYSTTEIWKKGVRLGSVSKSQTTFTDNILDAGSTHNYEFRIYDTAGNRTVMPVSAEVLNRPSGVSFSGLSARAFDRNKSTTHQINSNSTATLTWTGRDLGNTNLTIHATLNEGTMDVTAYDKNDVQLNTIRVTYHYMGFRDYNLFLPEGTVKIKFTTKSTGMVAEITEAN